MPRALWLLLAIAGAALAASTASAQVPTQMPTSLMLEITPFEAPIAPTRGLGEADLEIRYAYFSAAGLASTTATRVELHVTEAPSWVTVTISPSTILVPLPPPSGPSTMTHAPPQHATLYVATTADAPAFYPGGIRIVAVAYPNGALAASEAEVQTLAQADYGGYVDVEGVPSVVRIERGGEASFPVTITNHANGNTKVTASLDRPIAGLSVTGLLPLTLESKQTGGTVTSHAGTVQLAADDDFDGAVAVVTVIGRYALNDRIALEPFTLRIPIEAVGDAKRSFFSNAPEPGEDGGLVEAQSASLGGAPGGLPLTLAIAGALGGAWIGARKWKARNA